MAQSSGWGSSQACYRLCLRRTTKQQFFRLARQDPQAYATWLGSASADNPGMRQISGSSTFRHPANSRAPIFLFTVPDSTTGPSRFPQSGPCDVLVVGTFTLSSVSSYHRWREARIAYPVEDATAPPALSLAGAVEAHAFELPDVLAFTSGPDAACPGCHSALADRTLPSQLLGRTRTVSFVQSRLWGVLWSARYPCQYSFDPKLLRA